MKWKISVIVVLIFNLLTCFTTTKYLRPQQETHEYRQNFDKSLQLTNVPFEGVEPGDAVECALQCILEENCTNYHVTTISSRKGDITLCTTPAQNLESNWNAAASS